MIDANAIWGRKLFVPSLWTHMISSPICWVSTNLQGLQALHATLLRRSYVSHTDELTKVRVREALCSGRTLRGKTSIWRWFHCVLLEKYLEAWMSEGESVCWFSGLPFTGLLSGLVLPIRLAWSPGRRRVMSDRHQNTWMIQLSDFVMSFDFL